MLEVKPEDRIENFSLVLNQLDEVLSESGATIVIPHKPPKKEKRKPLLTPSIRKVISIFILLGILSAIMYFFIDMTEIQYAIEDIFFPPEEFQGEQPNFIELDI